MTINNTLSKIVIFAVGAVIGSAVTYKVVETKCRREAAEEVEAVREYYEASVEKTEETADSDDDEENQEEEYPDAPDEYYEKELPSERTRYRDIMKSNGYSNEEEEDDDMGEPYIIRPEEYGEEGYAEISLTYYADGVVTNERNKIIKNVDELIGSDALNHFGEYEDDSVFVRNDKIKVDYEILKDYREFSEIS